MDSVDILIVGSGIAGASAAFELAPHARVLLAEREGQHGYHTTGRSAALYMASYGNDPIRRLTRASRGFFDAPPTGFTEHPLLRARGALYFGGPGEEADLNAMLAELRASGVVADAVTAAEVLRRVPVLYPEAVVGGVYEPGAADVDVDALHTGYLRGARERGAEIRLSAEVATLTRGADGWTAVFTDGTQVRATTVVNAAGAWAGPLGVQAGATPIALSPLRRTAILLDAPPSHDTTDWPMLCDVKERFYFKPEAGKLLASPADETPSEPCDAYVDDMDVALCVERIQAVADVPVRRAPKSWAGLRTFAPDRTPVIGFDAQAKGFFWLAGQGGYGVQTAPAIARLAAALLLDQPLPDDLGAQGLAAAVSPSRFG